MLLDLQPSSRGTTSRKGYFPPVNLLEATSVERSDGFHTSFMTEGERAEVYAFLTHHREATFCHHPGWVKVLQEAYGKPVRFLLLRSEEEELAGVAPIVDMSSWMFGKQWVSLPYQDYGGPLASNPIAESALVDALKHEAVLQGCRLDLRCGNPLTSYYPAPVNDKVAMTLSLEGLTEEVYWKKLNAQVRNQVRKAEKSQVSLKRGGLDQLDAFYSVFCENSRNLGSPVHARRFFESVLEHIPGTEIVTAWREGRCIGGLVRIRFQDTVAIPWAATLKEERIHCANNAMYYDSICMAFRDGFTRVDFGRSTRGEGTFRYKAQWLAQASPLPWYQFDVKGRVLDQLTYAKSSLGLRMVSQVWTRMPLSLANRLGPYLRPTLAA
jgi:serine/alanine adding enzyme